MNRKITYIGITTYISLVIKSFFVMHFISGRLNILGVLVEATFLGIIIFFISLCNPKISNVLLIIVNFLFSFFLLTTIMYFDFYHSVFTYHSLAQLDQAGTVQDGILALFKIHYLLLFIDILFLFFFILFKKRFNKPSLIIRKKQVGTFMLISLMCIGFGMYSATTYISEIDKYENVGLIGYQLYEASLDIKELFVGDREINAELVNKSINRQMVDNPQLIGVGKNNNIIIVQLESVQNFFINLVIDGKEVTPNLNQLVKESIYFPKFYTQVGKGNTSDAEFIVNSSIYAVGDEAMTTVVNGKTVPSLPRKLEENGYHTATFHTNTISFWNRANLYKSLGFNEYFDKEYFRDEDIISYGASDEILYEDTIEKLVEFRDNGEKFYSHIIALSSHFPFTLPEEKKRLAITLSEEYQNSIVGDYIVAVSYADYAFGKFMNEIKENGLLDESIIIVYGDHQGLQMKNEHDKKLVRNLLGREYDEVLDRLNIPFTIRLPKSPTGRVIETVGGLVDIYPTLANLMDIDIRNEILFGVDLLNTKENLVGSRFYTPTGTYISNTYAFTPEGGNGKGLQTNIQTRKTTPANRNTVKELEKIIEIYSLSDQYIHSLTKE